MTATMPDTPRRRTENRWPRRVQHLVVFVLFIALWEIAVQQAWVSRLILPSPFAVAASWWNLAVATGLIWQHFFVTLWEVLLGFLIGAVFGGGVAILSSMMPTFRDLV